MTVLILLLAMLAPLTHATPVRALQLAPRSLNTLTSTTLTHLAPSTATCDRTLPFASECRTATQSAPLLSLSFTNFNISTFGSQAALVSLVLYESGNFVYSTNHYPGVPGQGTRNMQSATYNAAYATWLATRCVDCGVEVEEVRKAQGEGPEKVLELVNGDVWGFASAAWFLRTQCAEGILEGLDWGSREGWERYLTECVGATVTEERSTIWEKAIAMGNW